LVLGIDQSQVADFTITICTGIGEMMNFCFGDFTEIMWDREDFQLSHRDSSSPSRVASHEAEILHISWSIFLPFKMNGERKPKGSNMDAMVERTPERVLGFDLMDELNVKASDLSDHRRPKVLSMG